MSALLRWLVVLSLTTLAIGCASGQLTSSPATFSGSKPGVEREVAGVKLCWCPPGKFTMGSPPDEAERRADEDQVEVTTAVNAERRS